MADNENIGGVGINVTADFSDLDAQFDAAIQKAQQRSDAMAAAIQDGVKAPDVSPVTGALDQIGTAAQATGQEVRDSLQFTAPTLDTSQVEGALSSLVDAASSTSQQVVQDLSAIQAPAIDTAPAVSSLDALASAVQGTLQDVAGDFTNAASGSDAFNQAMANLVGEGATVNEAFQQLTGSSQSFMEALSSGALEQFMADFGKVAGDSQEAASGLQQVAGAATDAAGQMRLFDEAVDVPFADATGQLNLFAGELEIVAEDCKSAAGAVDAVSPSMQEMANDIERAGNSAGTAAPKIKDVGDESASAGAHAHEAGGSFAEMAEKLAAVSEALVITEGMREFGAEALKASDNITKVSIALGTITGSAEQAEGTIQGLEKLGMSDGLSFPSLYTAGTRMQQLLGPGADVVGILGKIADGASVMGTDIGSAANAFDRLVTSGNASAKTLIPLGLNMESLAAAMNKLYPSLDATSESAKKLFKDALNDNGRIAVLQTALEGLGGTAQKVADQTFGGQWQRLENQWEQVMAEVGKALMPAITALTDFASQVASAIKETVDWFNQLSAPVKEAAVDFGLLVAAIVPVAGALSGVALAFSGLASLGEVTAALFGLEGGFAAIGEALFALAPEITAFAAAAAAIHFSGLDQSVLDFFITLKDDLPGLADLFSPITEAAKGMFDAMYQWSGLKDIIDIAGIGLDALGVKLDGIKAKAEAATKGLSVWDLTGVGEAKRLLDGLAQTLDYLSGHYKVMTDALGANNPVMIANNKNMHDAAQAAMEAAGEFDKHKSSTDGLKASVEALQPSMVKLAQATHDLVDNTKAATDPMNVLAASEAAAGENIIKLTENVGHANANLITAADNMARVTQQYKDGQVGADAYTKAQQQLADAVKTAAQETDNLTNAQIKFANAISAQNLNIDPVNKALSDMDATLKSLGPDMDLIPPKMSPLNQAMIDAGVNTQKAKNAFEDLHTPLTTIITDMDNLVAAAQKSGDWSGVLTGLDNFDKRINAIAKTDLPEAVKQIEAMIDELKNANAPAGLIAGQLDKFGASIEKMAREQLPGWHQAWQNYLTDLAQFPPASSAIVENLQLQIDKQNAIVQGLINHKAALYDVQAAEAAALQSEISYASKTGQDANDQVLALEKIKLQWDANALASHGYADQAVQAINDVVKGFDQLGGAMADAIVNGKNLGDALVAQFKKIGQSILTDVLNAALIPLKQALLELISSLLPSVGGALSAVGGGIGALSSSAGTASAGLTNLAAAANAAATSISASVGQAGTKDGSQAASGLTGAVTNLTNTINLVANIISAGAAVVGDVYLAAMDTKLFHIETSLLEIRNETENRRKDAWDQFNTMYGRLGEVMNDTHAMRDTLAQMLANGTGGGFPDQAMADLDAIAANTDAISKRLVSMDGGLDTIAHDLVTWIGYLLDPVYVIRDKVGQILTYVMAGNDLMAHAVTGDDLQSAANDITSAIDSGAGDTVDSIDNAAGQTTSGIASAAHSNQQAMAAQSLTITGAIQTAAASTPPWATQQLAEQEKQYRAAQTTADQVTALQSEYATYQTLMGVAIQQGDLALANAYQQQMTNLAGQITPLLSADVSATQQLQQVVTSGASTMAFAATGAGALVAAHVDAAAVNIANAVAKTPVNFSPTSGGTTTNVPAGGGPASGPGSSTYSAPSPTAGSSGGGPGGFYPVQPPVSAPTTSPTQTAAPFTGSQPVTQGPPVGSQGTGVGPGQPIPQPTGPTQSGTVQGASVPTPTLPPVHPRDLPTFNLGGPVVRDMVANLHAGEYVIAPDLTAMLRQMASTPSMGALTSTPSGDSRGAPRMITINAPVTINGMRGGRQAAQDFVEHLKRIIPDANGYSN